MVIGETRINPATRGGDGLGGSGGHLLVIIPALETVLVHRTDTENGRAVDIPDVWRLFEQVLQARSADAKSQPALKPVEPIRFANALPPPPQRKAVPLDLKAVRRVVGTYEGNMGHPIQLEVFLFENQLFAEPAGAAEMQLLAESPMTYFSITGDTHLEFVQGTDGVITHLNVSRTDRPARLNRIK